MYKKILCQTHTNLTFISPPHSKFFSSFFKLLDSADEVIADRLAPALQACCDRSLLRQGRQLHAQVVCNGLSQNNLLGTRVLALYVLCGRFSHAKSVFHGLDLRFASPWNWMIRWFVTKGLFDASLRFYFKMLGYGVSPDKYTFPAVIKACGALRNVRLARQVHDKVELMGLKADVFVGSSLIKVYADNGFVRDARKLFDKMPHRDSVMWNTMLNGYAKNGDTKSTVEMFLGLCESETRPGSVSFACILSVCASEDLLGFGTQLHGLAIVCGLELDSPVANTLMAMYSKCQRLSDARKLFNLMPETDVVTWNGMISGFVHNGFMFEASCCFRDMISARVKPDSITFATFLPVVTDSTSLKQGKEIHGYIIKHDVTFDVFLKSALIDLYFKCRDVEMARKLLKQSADVDVIVCTTMISGFVLNGLSQEALEIFRWISRERMKPNSVTLASVFPAFGALAALKLGRELHGNVLKNGHDVKCYVGSAIMDMYAKCGRLDLANRMFQRIPVKDSVCWNTMITGYSQNGKPEEAIKLFRQMGLEGMKYDHVSVSAGLSACANLPALHYGKEIHALITRQKLGSDVFSESALIDMYAKCGDLSSGRQVFKAMRLKNEVSWNSIIAAYGSHGRLEECLSLFHQMLENRIPPDHVTFIGILSACGHSGRVDDGLEFFRRMTRDFKIRPRTEHYACIVDLLGRAGRLTEALDTVKTMPFAPDSAIWGTLLGACRVHGNVGIAEEAFRRLFELEPRNSGYYTLLSNVHAGAGDWENVLKIRGLMKERGVRKVPGYSWIEIGKATRVFVAADASHPESGEIFGVLKSLLLELRKEGYVPQLYLPLHPQMLRS